MIVNSIKIDIINKILQRILINEILINRDAQISKNTFNYKVMCVNEIDCISRDYENNKDDIKSNVEHRIYKRFNNKLILISLEQVF